MVIRIADICIYRAYLVYDKAIGSLSSRPVVSRFILLLLTALIYTKIRLELQELLRMDAPKCALLPRYCNTFNGMILIVIQIVPLNRLQSICGCSNGPWPIGIWKW